VTEKSSLRSDMAEFLEHIEELMYQRGFSYVCGVDEAGRGPLAGPVVAAAVILPLDVVLDCVDDSKKLTSHQRDDVFAEIVRLEIPCAVGIIDSGTIDQVNILKASLIAMRKAIMELKQAPDVILVDGNQGIPGLSQPQFTIVGGDRRCKSIAAASVVAKVTRDRIMENYESLYPNFSFATHKGYPTAAHLAELKQYGPCEIHRRSFRPVATLLNQYALFE
jgi:ribonuclease HII